MTEDEQWDEDAQWENADYWREKHRVAVGHANAAYAELHRMHTEIDAAIVALTDAQAAARAEAHETRHIGSRHQALGRAGAFDHAIHYLRTLKGNRK